MAHFINIIKSFESWQRPGSIFVDKKRSRQQIPICTAAGKGAHHGNGAPIHREFRLSFKFPCVTQRNTWIWREKKKSEHNTFTVSLFAMLFCLHKNSAHGTRYTKKASSLEQWCIGYCTCILLRNIRFSFALFSPPSNCHFFRSSTTVRAKIAPIFARVLFSSEFLCLFESAVKPSRFDYNAPSTAYLSLANIINVWLFKTTTQKVNGRNRDRAHTTSFVQLYGENR